tara:strand:+ start:230 stop:541 length:312 start_codon:yes stop_codon:yes gene_type:complete
MENTILLILLISASTLFLIVTYLYDKKLIKTQDKLNKELYQANEELQASTAILNIYGKDLRNMSNDYFVLSEKLEDMVREKNNNRVKMNYYKKRYHLILNQAK